MSKIKTACRVAKDFFLNIPERGGAEENTLKNSQETYSRFAKMI